MNGPSQRNQPSSGTIPVEVRLPKLPREASSAAESSTMASSMPTTSKTTAALLILVVICVDQMMSAAWTATVRNVSSAALVGV